MKRIAVLLLLLLTSCSYTQIALSELEQHKGEHVELIGSFFDDYNQDYKQFADSNTYIYVKAKGNFTYKYLYLIKGKVESCQISSSKNKICLKADKIEEIT